MNRIIITGATGFIGKNLIETLSKEYDVLALVRKSSNTEHLLQYPIKIIRTDFSETDLTKILSSVDIIVHIAGQVNAKTKLELYNSNVFITKNLVNAAEAKKVKKFFFISTIITDSKIQGLYSETKKQAEDIVVNSNLNYIIFKPSVIYGKYDNKQIYGLINLIKNNKIIPIFGSGNYKIQPIFIDDFVRYISLAIHNKVISKKIFVLAGPEPITFNDAVNIIENNLNKKVYKIKIPIFIAYLTSIFYSKFSSNPQITPEQVLRLKEDKIYNIEETVKYFKHAPISFKEGIEKIIK